MSDKMEKTVVVQVTRTYRHHLYKKVIAANKRYKAHDVLGCKIGDQVKIVESQPISRHKRWVVEEILERAEGGSEVVQADAEVTE